MHFTNNNHTQPFSLKIDHVEVEIVESTKFLGVQIDKKLTWVKHINQCRNKISSGLYALRTVKNILNSNQLKLLYYTLIHPYINYSNTVWGSASKTNLKCIKTLQNKAIKTITNAKYNDHVSPLYLSTKIPTYETVYNRNVALFMFQQQNKTLPKLLLDMYKQNTETHQHNTRHHNHPHIETRRTKQITNSILHRGPKLWYEIPNNIKEVRSIALFRKKIKQHFRF